MVDIEFISQLVDSMEDSVLRLEKAIEAKDINAQNKLKVFIFDLHKQIANLLNSKDKGELKKKHKKKKRRKSRRYSKKK